MYIELIFNWLSAQLALGRVRVGFKLVSEFLLRLKVRDTDSNHSYPFVINAGNSPGNRYLP